MYTALLPTLSPVKCTHSPSPYLFTLIYTLRQVMYYCPLKISNHYIRKILWHSEQRERKLSALDWILTVCSEPPMHRYIFPIIRITQPLPSETHYLVMCKYLLSTLILFYPYICLFLFQVHSLSVASPTLSIPSPSHAPYSPKAGDVVPQLCMNLTVARSSEVSRRFFCDLEQ